MKAMNSPGRYCLHSAFVLALVFGGLFWAEPCIGAKEEPPIDLLRKTSSAFVALSEMATPAVVFIKAERTIEIGGSSQQYFYNDPFDIFGDEFMERFFGGRGNPPQARRPRQYKQQGQGSGFIITKDGYILTNHHVVGDADKITVKLPDGREFEAKRIGTDPKSEVALIKIEGKDFPYLEMGDSSLIRVGEWAIAIGNPFGLTATVTGGLISAKGRSSIGIADYENFIQTDAAINPGNSGGPLLNIDGKVIGINTAIYSRSGGYMGIGFAIPINMAKQIKDQLMKDGKVTRGYLGIVIQDLTSELAKSFGLKEAKGILIADLTKDAAGAKAGLMQGDVILKMNDRDVQSVGAFRNEVASNPPGTELKLTLYRDGKEKVIKVKTGELPGDAELSGPSLEASEKLGFAVTELTAEAAKQHGYEADSGVLVSEVEQGSAAWHAGMRPGLLIMRVNRRKVSSVEQFNKAVSAADDAVLLLVSDGTYSRYIVLRAD